MLVIVISSFFFFQSGPMKISPMDDLKFAMSQVWHCCVKYSELPLIHSLGPRPPSPERGIILEEGGGRGRPGIKVTYLIHTMHTQCVQVEGHPPDQDILDGQIRGSPLFL